MRGHRHLRAVGVRIGYGAVPRRVRDWVEQALGAPVATATTQPGGMSPGCAARLRLVDGRRAFVKAVGLDLNADTAGLHRHEARVLAALPDVSWRPRLLATYDDGDWVALVLEDVEGRHPDWLDGSDLEVVLETVERQSRELAVPPLGLPAVPTFEANTSKWASALDEAGPEGLAALPAWFHERREEVDARLAAVGDQLAGDGLCHFDVRNDNILIRPGSAVVLADWGLARLGPPWVDTVKLAGEWAETPVFDDICAASPFLAGVEGDPATGLLLALGAFLAVSGTWEPPAGLPTLPAFRARQGRRFLEGARRRLGA